jgi:hypothetical protein
MVSASRKPPSRGSIRSSTSAAAAATSLRFFGGLNVRGYRLVNVALHVMCAMLLFLILKRHLSNNVAFATALIWMVHPLVTEPADYVSQRTELMMAAFLLAPVYAAQRGRLVLSIVCCALGMACKETMVVAPLVALLYDRTFTFESFRDALRRRGWSYAALCATWLALVSTQRRIPVRPDAVAVRARSMAAARARASQPRRGAEAGQPSR